MSYPISISADKNVLHLSSAQTNLSLLVHQDFLTVYQKGQQSAIDYSLDNLNGALKRCQKLFGATEPIILQDTLISTWYENQLTETQRRIQRIQYALNHCTTDLPNRPHHISKQLLEKTDLVDELLRYPAAAFVYKNNSYWRNTMLRDSNWQDFYKPKILAMNTTRLNTLLSIQEPLPKHVFLNISAMTLPQAIHDPQELTLRASLRQAIPTCILHQKLEQTSYADLQMALHQVRMKYNAHNYNLPINDYRILLELLGHSQWQDTITATILYASQQPLRASNEMRSLLDKPTLQPLPLPNFSHPHMRSITNSHELVHIACAEHISIPRSVLKSIQHMTVFHTVYQNEQALSFRNRQPFSYAAHDTQNKASRYAQRILTKLYSGN